MLSIDDLDPQPHTPASTLVETAPEHPASTPAPLVANSPTARALFSVFSGNRITVVDSPPGAGKSELVATVAAHLTQRSHLSVVVATSTLNQAIAISHRIAEQVPSSRIYVAIKNLDPDQLPEGAEVVTPGSRVPDHAVTIRTVASCQITSPDCDVLIVDEAYQTTFAQVLYAANSAEQVLLVGDPGQIGPVVTSDVSHWHRQSIAPHHQAPHGFKKADGALTINLDTTWRLGERTVEAIAPLYPFPFTSGRPDRHLATADGTVLDEIASFTAPSTGGDPYNLDLLRLVAERAADLVDTELVTGDVTVPLTPEDVAVVVSHNAQASTIGAMLSAWNLSGVTVGTADRLQGGQWHAVVALDPLCGYEGLSPHSMSLGRLCVMASRHLTHLSWFADEAWPALLANETADRHLDSARAVREALCR